MSVVLLIGLIPIIGEVIAFFLGFTVNYMVRIFAAHLYGQAVQAAVQTT